MFDLISLDTQQRCEFKNQMEKELIMITLMSDGVVLELGNRQTHTQ